MGDDKKSLWFLKKTKKFIYFLAIISSIIPSRDLNNWEVDNLELSKLELGLWEEEVWKIEDKNIVLLKVDLTYNNSQFSTYNWDNPFWLNNVLSQDFSLQRNNYPYNPNNFFIKKQNNVIKSDNWWVVDLNNEKSKLSFIEAFWSWIWTTACLIIDIKYGWWKWNFLDIIRAIASVEWDLRFWIKSKDKNRWSNISTFQINGESKEEAMKNYSKYYDKWIRFIKNKLGLEIPKDFVKWKINLPQEELITYIWYLDDRSLVKNKNLFVLLSESSHTDKGFAKMISKIVQWWIDAVWEDVVELLSTEKVEI